MAKSKPSPLDFAHEVALIVGRDTSEHFVALAVGDTICVAYRDEHVSRRATITKVKQSPSLKGCVVIDFEVAE